MRLPLRHPPPPTDTPLRRCAHLEALAEASLGLGLGPAAALVAATHARGRFGNALQWHFGLDPHDSSEQLDWEDRIELKLVSVWRRRDGRLACDKLKVCDITADPWRKLGNVLWVFADRMTRVIVGHRFNRLAGPARSSLAAAWDHDPHFDRPALFVEAREQDERQAPAYYLSAAWLAEHVLPAASAPADLPGVFRFDAKWWSDARAHGRRHRDPLLALWRDQPSLTPSTLPCPRCGGPLHHEVDRLRSDGWSPALHAMPLGPECGLRAHAVLAASGLPLAPGALGWDDLVLAVEGRVAPGQVLRLSDHVLEPDDHEHD
jgi:hypothetical protein